MLSMNLLFIEGNLCSNCINVVSSYILFVITAVFEIQFQVFQGLRNIRRDIDFINVILTSGGNCHESLP